MHTIDYVTGNIAETTEMPTEVAGTADTYVEKEIGQHYYMQEDFPDARRTCKT